LQTASAVKDAKMLACYIYTYMSVCQSSSLEGGLLLLCIFRDLLAAHTDLVFCQDMARGPGQPKLEQQHHHPFQKKTQLRHVVFVSVCPPKCLYEFLEADINQPESNSEPQPLRLEQTDYTSSPRFFFNPSAAASTSPDHPATSGHQASFAFL